MKTNNKITQIIAIAIFLASFAAQAKVNYASVKINVLEAHGMNRSRSYYVTVTTQWQTQFEGNANFLMIPRSLIGQTVDIKFNGGCYQDFEMATELQKETEIIIPADVELYPTCIQHNFTGKVTDLSTGKPVKDALITIDAVNFYAQTDEEGNYDVTIPIDGGMVNGPTFTFRTFAEGYFSAE